MEIALCRMLNPMPLPVVIHVRLEDFVLLLYTLSKEFLHSLHFGKRYVRPIIKYPSTFMLERRRVATPVWILVEHDRSTTCLLQSIRRTESRHSCT